MKCSAIDTNFIAVIHVASSLMAHSPRTGLRSSQELRSHMSRYTRAQNGIRPQRRHHPSQGHPSILFPVSTRQQQRLHHPPARLLLLPTVTKRRHTLQPLLQGIRPQRFPPRFPAVRARQQPRLPHPHEQLNRLRTLALQPHPRHLPLSTTIRQASLSLRRRRPGTRHFDTARQPRALLLAEPGPLSSPFHYSSPAGAPRKRESPHRHPA